MSLFGSKNSAIRITVFGKTDVGRNREHNEDSFLVADLTTKQASLHAEVRDHDLGEKGSLLVVADGMGGAAAGEVASAMATKVIYEHMTERWGKDNEATPQQFAYRLKEAVEEANAHIHAYAKEHPESKGMGTTTTAVGVLGDHLYLTQVGDSRCYLVRDGKGVQLTKDQSLMQRLVDAGELTEEEAERSERRNIILQALGPDPRVRVDLTHQEVRRGDIIVMCSDGLSGQVRRNEIADCAMKYPDPADACTTLIEMANDRGGPDNITVVVAHFGGDGLKVPQGDETVGHEVYPLLDTESTTEPVPVYKGSAPPQPKGNGT
ncbi:MAG: Stp1/IreP family PP2C-type Ser/Thr phosphatase [Gemmatimonadetes bacterium]|nr:Stp1/IreP family PP2C-type Ser/Thr phosphatase [Gemmatimonadota bacterium]